MNQNLHLNDSFLNFWEDKNIRQLVRKQIQQANLQLYKITANFVFLKYCLKITGQEKSSQNMIHFIVALSKGFPLSPPQIHVNDSFLASSLKDYRDLRVELIGQQWHWSLKLQDVLQKIPKFITRIEQLKGNYYAIQKIGQFHRNKVYEYELLRELSPHLPFISFQQFQEQVQMFVLSVTSTHILVFKPIVQPFFAQNKLVVPRENDIKAMKLIFLAEIQTINEITHNRNNKNEYNLAFTCFHLKKMQYVKVNWAKTLNITRSHQFLQTLIKQLKHYKIEIGIEVGNVKNDKIEQELIAQMYLQEQKFKHYFNIGTLFSLGNSYQKLVEFYSAQGPPYQEIYVNKIAMLYKRSDVKLILEAQDISTPIL